MDLIYNKMDNGIIASSYTKIFWNEYLLNKKSTEYNMILDQNIKGNLDIERLKKTFLKIVENYPLLNKKLGLINDELYWVECPEKPSLIIYDKPVDAIQLLKVQFQLDKEIPARFFLIKKDELEYRLIVVIHHCLIDGVTGAEFYSVIESFYNNKNIDPCLKISEKEIHDSNQALNDKVDFLKQNLNSSQFWTNKLNICPVSVQLPRLNCYPMSSQQRPIQFTITAERWQVFKKQVRHCSHFMAFKTLWAAVVSRYCNQQDIYLSYPIAMVKNAKLAFGSQVNTAVFPFSLVAGQTFNDSYKQTLHYHSELKAGQGLRHSALPIYDAITQSKINKLDICFSQAFIQEMHLNFEDCTLQENREINLNLAGASMIFEYQPVNDDFIFRLRYSSDKVSDLLAENMAKSFEYLFQQLSVDMSRSLDSYPLLPMDVQQFALSSKPSRSQLDPANTLIDLFDKQAANYPHRQALTDENGTIDYQTLWQLSHRVALKLAMQYQQLFGRPLQRGDYFACYLPKGNESVIAILAILRLGLAYVPLDTTMPEHRLQYIFDDLGQTLVLTHREYGSTLSQYPNVQTLYLDQLDFTEAFTTYLPTLQARGDDTAYVIYTSGTSGKPKGTLVSHTGVINMVAAVQDLVAETDPKAQTILQFAAMVFDAHVCETFLALTQGHHLCIASERMRQDLSLLLKYLEQWQINVALLPPALLTTYPEFPRSLHTLLLGGESTSQDIVDHYRHCPIRLVNAYGPTEASVLVTLNSDWQESAKDLGQAIAGVQLVVVDQYMNPVPDGVMGELCISGPALAKGYLNQSELTDKSFVTNPFCFEPGFERLYHTGDLVCRSSDGRFQYQGRLDHQVKINGYRIELDEIEQSLLNVPSVQQAVVRAHGKQSPQLLAWYVANETVTQQQVMHFLSQRLPHYMLPQAIMRVESIPLNLNGKIDFSALSTPTEIKRDTPQRLPQTPLEATLADLFSSLLNRTVSIDDNFYRSGGNSILAIRLCHEIHKSLSISLSVVEFNAHPSVEELAQHLQQSREKPQPQNKLVIPALSLSRAPLSTQQARLWYIDHLDQGQAHYHIPFLFQLDNSCQHDKFKRALQQLVERHQILRTVIVTEQDGSTWQQVTTQALVVTECRLSPHMYQRWLEASLTQPFDLAKHIPVRAALVHRTRSDQSEVTECLLVFHHIAFDGWSLRILLEDLETIYRQLTDEAVTQLAPLPIQYSDYASWQQQQSATNQPDLDYWLKQLENYQHLSLPIDFKRPAHFDVQGACHQQILPASLIERLQTMAEEQNVSLHTVLLSGFALMLRHYCVQQEIIIGSPMINRNQPEVERLIGFFVNVLPLRLQADENESVTQFIQHTFATTQAALVHQSLSFDELVQHLEPHRDLSRHPVFQVIFSIEEQESVSLPLLTPISLQHFDTCAKYDLGLRVQFTDEQVSAIFNYPIALFKAETIRLLASYFERVLQQMVDAPERNISHLQLLDQPSYQRLYAAPHYHQPVYDYHRRLYDDFIEMAHCLPDNIALIDEHGEMSYRQLYQAATLLANQLYQDPQIQGEAIAFLLPKGRLQPIAMLGIMLAGKAFLPMDSTWPLQRQRQVMQQAGINGMITDSLQSDHPCYQILLHGDQPLSQASEGDKAPLVSVMPSDLAYIIYTSGSTGTPKGVAIMHQGVVNTLQGCQQCIPLTYRDRVLALSAPSFDLAIYDIFAAFSAGAAVVFPHENKRYQPAHWFELIESYHVSVWLSAPALMEVLLDYLENQCLSSQVMSLRTVIVGGDWIPITLARRVNQHFHHAQSYSIGGATETSLFSLLYPIPSGVIKTRSIPYGWALPHQYCYIFDSQLEPVAIGVKGEIYIGGAGIAREYWKDTEKTEQSFIWHPKLAMRLYKSGDYGRWMEDGNIEFLGRADFQLKINGYRVETGEIENTLLGIAAITSACVWICEAFDNKLVAWYVAPEALDEREIKQILAQSLPFYMQPQALVHLTELPLTNNGKVDRKQLPAPILTDEHALLPETHLEKQCCQIWAELLSLENVSVNRNFFALGGNSLKAIQLTYRMKNQLNMDVSLSELAIGSGIRELCLKHSAVAEPVVSAYPVALGQKTYCLSQAQKQLFFIERLNGASSLYHVPLLWQLDETVELNAFEQALRWVMARHQGVSCRFITSAQGELYSEYAPHHLEIAQQQVNEADWSSHLEQWLSEPFDLEKDIPVRISLIHCQQPDHSGVIYCLLVLHHVVFDGTSIPILYQEVDHAYQAFLQKRLPSLAPLSLQYGDYAQWQQQRLHSPEKQRLVNWWQAYLQDWQPLCLPVDFVRPAQFDHHGENVLRSLPLSLVEKIQHQAASEGISEYAFYCSAFAILLGRFSDQQDILIGSPMVDRPDEQTQALMGYFVNSQPLRVKLRPDLTPQEIRRQLFSQILQIYQHQLPLDQIMDALNVPRDLSSHALFQTLFLFEQQSSLTPPTWLQPQDLGLHYPLAKFDLTLNVSLNDKNPQVVFNFATALFSRETVGYLADYYLCILQQLVMKEISSVSAIKLISDEHVATLRQQREATPPQYDFKRPIWADFVSWVQKTPHALALIDSLGCMSYVDLYHAALRLAGQLRQSQAMQGQAIAVLVEKGRAQLIAVIACGLAGKPYLPMDFAWPESRRNEVMKQAKAEMAIVSQPWQGLPGTALVTINGWGQVDELAEYPGEVSPAQVSAEDMAYVIFTSGSTGVPKGVAVSHQGAVNTIVDTIDKLELNANDRALAISALSFDISVFDIYGMLSAGASLVFPTEQQRFQPEQWLQLLVKHQVTFWNSAPSVMSLLVEYIETLATPPAVKVRHVVLVGEVIAKTLAPRLYRWIPDCVVQSTGGATESSIWSIHYAIPNDNPNWPSVPYGKPMQHQTFYILDADLHPQPVGIPGEQYIGGAGVALGYINNPVLTDERFIWHEALGERLYRTGDRGRWLPDGNMEFLGRIDFQVKLNGYRIELNEVEHVAMACAEMVSCCAIVSEQQDLQQLILYYVCKQPLDETQLLSAMSQRLPLYMLPAQLICLESMPLNANGKLDRKALPAPATGAAVSAYVAPVTVQQKALCQLWQQALERTQVGITDNFFALGGTSLKAIALCAQMSRVLERQVQVVELFQKGSIKALLKSDSAKLSWAMNRASAELKTVWLIHPAMTGAEAFNDLAQAADGKVHCRAIDNYNLYHQPAITELSDLAERYLLEMESVQPITPDSQIAILGWSLGGIIALQIAALLEQRGVTHLSVLLLDSFYQQKLTRQIDKEKQLAILGITGDAAQRAMAISEIEHHLAGSAVSSPLQHTKVTLLKATESASDLASDELQQLIQCEDNGLRAIVPDLSIERLACTHQNIIEHQEVIIQHLLSSFN